jgi:hypothetical protein
LDRRRACFHRLHLLGVYLASVLAFPVALQALARAPAVGVETGAASPEQKITVISPPDIPDRADADERFIRAAVARSQSANPKGHFEQTLEGLSSGVRRLAAQSNDVARSTLSLRTLASLQRHWLFYERAVSRWRVAVQRVTKESLADATGLTSRRAVWEATRVAAADSAPALLQRVEDLIDQIDQAEKTLSLSLEKTLDLERRGNEPTRIVDC